ncbi:MAG: cytochrome P450 [Verrucomicrobiota bacterium]
MTFLSKLKKGITQRKAGVTSTKKRYFGIEDLCFHGGVFNQNSVNLHFHVGLIDSSGEVIVSTLANKNSLKAEISDGHGFSLPVPYEWLKPFNTPHLFQFKVLETGEIFPKAPRELPTERLLRNLEKRKESTLTLRTRLKEATTKLAKLTGKKILVVGTHDMTRTGAPMIILEIIRHLKQRHDCEIILLSLAPKETLFSDFNEQCLLIVENLEQAFKTTIPEVTVFFAELNQVTYNQIALINSLCSTGIAEACAAAGMDVRSLIHEYPYAFDHEWVQRHFAAASNVVFPCQAVLQSFAARKFTSHTENSVTKFSVYPQGCYLLEKQAPTENDISEFTETFRSVNHLQASDRLVMSCGTVDSRKGFDWLTSLIIKYSKTSPHAANTHFLWVGSIGDKDLFFHAMHDLQQEGIIGHFHHLDETEDIRPALLQADVFLLCSRIDPFPSVVLESFLMGIPVVGFDKGQGSRDIIRETGFGIVVPYQNMGETIKAIDSLMGASDQRIRVKNQGATYVQSHHSYKNYVDALADWIFKDIPLENQKPHQNDSQKIPLNLNNLRKSIDHGIEYLSSKQHEDGEFETLISSNSSLSDGVWDSSPFVTSLLAHSLKSCLPASKVIIDRSLAFLESQMERGGVWRYYSNKQFKHTRIPPDLDDTSCASFVLKDNGREIPDNEWIFKSNQNSNHLFCTWLLADETSTEKYKAFLSDLEGQAAINTPPKPVEYEGNRRFDSIKDPSLPKEIDSVVNANVLLYLGENSDTESIVNYLVKLIDSNSEEGSSFYYHDVLALYYMIARACQHSAPSLQETSPQITARIESRFSSTLAEHSPLSASLAACTLITIAPESPILNDLITYLLNNQQGDGSWSRHPFYRGPNEYWGSEELTTGFCLEALSRHATLKDYQPSASASIKQPPEIFGSKEFLKNPYPYYNFLRHHHPVFFNEGSQTWLVSNYSDCLQVLKDDTTFTTHQTSFESALLGADGEKHERVRSVVQELFSLELIQALQKNIKQWAIPLFKNIRSRGCGDFMKEVAEVLPVKVIAYLLRLEPDRYQDMNKWADALLYPDNTTTDQKQNNPIKECRSFFQQHIDKERKNQTHDAFQELIQSSSGGKQLSDPEIIDICMLLMVAGFVTTLNLIGSSAMILALDKNLASQLRLNPQKIPTFIEEVLRFESPPQDVFRYTTKPTLLGGHTIAGGQMIQLLIGSANRDETQFADSEQFIFDRRPNNHLSFGHGAHQCIGMHLARLETKIAIELLLEQSDSFSANWPLDESPQRNYFLLRGPSELPMKFDVKRK